MHTLYMLTLYHGTTLAAARQILKTGWTVQPPEEHVLSVAREYGKESSALMQNLSERHRSATTPTRGSWASFALNEAVAERSWAQRAPEVRWEALWAIWRLDHPETPVEFKTVSQGKLVKKVEVLPRPGYAWVFQQTCREPLALLTLTISYEALIRLGARTDGFGHERLPPARALTGRYGPQPAGVAVPCPFKPSGSRLSLRPTERIVGWEVFADLLGLSDEEFQRQDRLGLFGTPRSDSVTPLARDEERPWWTFSAVQSQLFPS